MRIKYYSKNDLSMGYNLLEAELFLDDYDIGAIAISDINTAFEIYNITRLLESGIKLESWSDEKYEKLQGKCKALKGVVGRYFSSYDGEQFLSQYEDLDFIYRNDFVDVLEKYSIYKRISEESFSNFLGNATINVRTVIKHKKLVNAFESCIAKHFLKNINSAELLISHYYSVNGENESLFFPESLSDNDKRTIILEYINSDDANPNYLSLLTQPINDTGLVLDDSLRYLAYKRKEERDRELFSGHSGFVIGAEVSFVESDEDSADISDPLMPKFEYSKRWVENNTDFPTLLNNLIHVFGMVDAQGRCTFTASRNKIGVFDRLVGLKSKKEYMNSPAFYQGEIIHLLNLHAYDKLLTELGISIEEIIEWFFTEYLCEEFNAKGFTFFASTKGSSIREKCRNLLCEMDSVIKQFNLFAEHGKIDRGLLEFSSKPVFFSQVQSLINPKYVYLCDKDLAQASELLFSDQTMLGYTERTGSKYNTFVELVIKEDVTLDDYKHFQIPGIKFLFDKGIVVENKSGILEIDVETVRILKDLYDHEVISAAHLKDNAVLQKLIYDNKVCIENTLLSKSEQDYIDYVLNRHGFSNGIDLRNRYIHGTNPEEERLEDYYRCLLIMLLIVIKINEEFCLRGDLK